MQHRIRLYGALRLRLMQAAALIALWETVLVFRLRSYDISTDSNQTFQL